MVKPNKQGRRASMAGSSPMLSLFSPTVAPVDKKKKKANRRASITIGTPLVLASATVTTTASTQSTAQTRTTNASSSPPPPSPKTQHKTPPSLLKVPTQRRPSTPRNQQQQFQQQYLFEEVEICGMELLRSESVGTGDSFSYESYARDSFALAGAIGPPPGAIRSGMPYRTPSECGRSRRMSGGSSLGIDSADGILPQHPHQPPPQSYQLKNWPASRRRSSCGGNAPAPPANAAGADYNYYYGGQTQPTMAPRRNQRRASVGSGEDQMPGRRFPGSTPVRGMSRRGSTGTCDLPGFGAYKARRRASNGASSGVLGYVDAPPSVLLNDSLHGYGRRGSMGSYGRRGSMESHGSYGRRGSMESAVRRGSMESYGSYGRRGSMGSYGSYGRRGSMGSYGRRGSVASGKGGSLGSGDKEQCYAGLNDTLHSYGKRGSVGGRSDTNNNNNNNKGAALIDSSHESYRSGSSSGGGRPRM